MDEMISILKSELKYTNTILLAVNGATPRFDDSVYDMLRYDIFNNNPINKRLENLI